MSPSVSVLVTQSSLMQAYNMARKSGAFEPKRLNRALGIAQRNSTHILDDGRLDINVNDWHMATIKACDCEDHKRGTRYCKHIISAMLLYRAAQFNQQ